MLEGRVSGRDDSEGMVVCCGGALMRQPDQEGAGKVAGRRIYEGMDVTLISDELIVDGN